MAGDKKVFSLEQLENGAVADFLKMQEIFVAFAEPFIEAHDRVTAIVAELAKPLLPETSIAAARKWAEPASQISSALVLRRELQSQTAEIAARLQLAKSRFEEVFGPVEILRAKLTETFEPYKELAAALSRPEIFEFGESFVRQRKVKDAFDRAGWLPHPVIPDDVIMDRIEDGGEAISFKIEKYVEQNWDTISASFKKRFVDCELDDEALAAMDEALASRGHQLHRATCRVVFPEIERVTRLRLPSSDSSKMTSLQEVREAINDLTLHAFGGGFLWMSVFDHIQDACYAKVLPNATSEDFPIPNRHAVVHGRVSYGTPRDSMNCLVIADFMFMAIKAIISENEQSNAHLV